jgi:hypothetical protein
MDTINKIDVLKIIDEVASKYIRKASDKDLFDRKHSDLILNLTNDIEKAVNDFEEKVG